MVGLHRVKIRLASSCVPSQMVPTPTSDPQRKPPLLSFLMQVLICRNYRGDVDMSEVEHFMPILMEKEEEGMLSPILAHGGVRFMWIKHNNLYRIPMLWSQALGMTRLPTSTEELGSQRTQASHRGHREC